jgi:AbrB family looped-hinge helix DNA binding protein
MLTSRLTKKYQATLPVQVRKILQLKAGDKVAFEIENDTVVIRKVEPLEIEFLESLETTLNEWQSKYDEEAYSEL